MKTTKILLLIILLTVCYSCESPYPVLGKYDLKGVCEDHRRSYPDNHIVTIKQQGKKKLLIVIEGLVFKAYKENDSLFTIPSQSFKSYGDRAYFGGKGIIRNDSLFLHYRTAGPSFNLECDCKGKKIE